MRGQAKSSEFNLQVVVDNQDTFRLNITINNISLVLRWGRCKLPS